MSGVMMHRAFAGPSDPLMARGLPASDLAVALPRGAVTISRSWGQIQLERARQSSEGGWYETLRDDRFGQTVALVARVSSCRELPEGIIGGMSPGALLILHVDWAAVDRQLRAFVRDAGLSPAVARMTAAVFRCRDVRVAAAAAGLSYETARDYLKCARSAVGAANLQRLVTLIGEHIPSPAIVDAADNQLALADVLGLSPRQMLIAGMAADGTARRDIALRLSVSETLVKKELAIIFTTLGVRGVLGLARTMVELRLLTPAAAFLRNCPSSAQSPDHLLPPIAVAAIRRTFLVAGRDDPQSGLGAAC